jgi:beta-lactam-binding protein with PASTA domain
VTSAAPERPVLNGRYELHSRIARGGMADVFLAHDQLLDRPVAVKVLFPQFAAEPQFVERFRREAQAAANLNHPSIVAVFDWGEHDNTYFIVMEYVEGRSLAEVLRAEGTLHPDRASEIATDVAAALGFAHRNGTVHRDVKPGNILITPSGQVKVTDFGIARAFGGGDELTQSGSVMGTASYFSPEQAQGKPVDPRSDLYSLGVVLFEMVCGRPPFVGESPVQIAFQHVQNEPPMPTSINPAVPADLEGIIARLLAKNPATRYASAEDVRGDLRRFREGQPLVGIASAPVITPVNTNPAGPDTAGTRAVIDSTRAIPVAEAVDSPAAAGEYYEPPRRNGLFLISLGVLMLALVGLTVFIAQFLDNGAGTSGPSDVKVPNVINLSQSDAEGALTAVGLVADLRFEENGDVTPGLVFEQVPGDGEEIPEGNTVRLVVATDAKTVLLPDVTQFDEDEATRRLTQVGLSVDYKREASDDVPEGIVISMLPVPNQQVTEDTLVTLTISTGPAEVEVPDVKGLTVPEATNMLGQARLPNPQIVLEPSSAVQKGLVIRTDPEAGVAVPVSRTIIMVVSDGPETALVPPVVGLDEASARNAILNQGFEPLVQFVDVAFGDPNAGRVIGQSPAANEKLETGSSVTIQVGRALAPPPTVPDAPP